MTTGGETGVRLKFALALLLPALFLALPAVAGAGPAELATALAATVAALVTIGAGVRLVLTTAPGQVHTLSLRERAQLHRRVRLADPDAPGHARPRAPAPGSLAA